jgi:hypothetical protein
LGIWLARALPVAAALIAASPALAEDGTAPASRADPPPQVTFYWHNWTDGKGVSHLTHCKLSNFELRSLSPPAAPEWANRQAPGTASLITVVQPSGSRLSYAIHVDSMTRKLRKEQRCDPRLEARHRMTPKDK